MAEWLKAHAWKACIGETLSRVRIPLSPPLERFTFNVWRKLRCACRALSGDDFSFAANSRREPSQPCFVRGALPYPGLRCYALAVEQRSASVMLYGEWWVFRGDASVVSGAITITRDPKVFHWTQSALLLDALQSELDHVATPTLVQPSDDGYWRVGPTAPAVGLHTEAALIKASRHFNILEQEGVFVVEELRREALSLFKGDGARKCKSLAVAARFLVSLAEESASDCSTIKPPPKPLTSTRLAKLIERKRFEAHRAKIKGESFRSLIQEMFPPVIGRSVPVLVSRTHWLTAEGEISLQLVGTLSSGSWAEVSDLSHHIAAGIGTDLAHQGPFDAPVPDNDAVCHLLNVRTWQHVRYFECRRTVRDFRALEYKNYLEWFGAPTTNEIVGVSIWDLVKELMKQAQSNRPKYRQ